MVFNSIPFLFYFLPIVLFGYFLMPRTWRNAFLLVASLFFYAWGEPVLVLVFVASLVVNYGLSFWIHKALQTEGQATRRLALFFSLFVNLGLLAVFKYAGFAVSNFNALTGLSMPVPKLALPIGISFYTFQILSYLIDLYRGRVAFEPNFINVSCYVTLFPQLIAGPIVRFQTVAEELKHRENGFYDIERGIVRFVIGLAKKSLLADGIGALWVTVSAMPMDQLSTGFARLGLLAYAFQIYFDFSAYSDMAIGLGWILGFHFEENFNDPYMATSVTDFWRRWHISLSTWFREYVYIPLGGNRKGALRQVFNLLLVWFLTGLWHGANWNFVLWGLYFGLLLILEKFVLQKLLSRLPQFIGHIYTLFIVLISWAIFANDQSDRLFLFLKRLFVPGGLPVIDRQALYYALSYGMLLLICALLSTPYPRRLWAKFSGASSTSALALAKDKSAAAQNSSASVVKKRAILLRNMGLLLLWFLSIAAVVASSYKPFLYFRF